MISPKAPRHSRPARAINFAAAFGGDQGGNIAVTAALVLPLLVGGLGLGVEAATWYGAQRNMQNAADSAALAAATNGAGDYVEEARAVAAQYGFVHGVSGATVTVSNSAPCPAGGSDCYSVTVARPQALMLAQVAGYSGDATVGGGPAKRIAATAVAERATAPREYCLLALGTNTPTALLSNGAPMADLSGCNVMSNSNATCNGHDLGADIGDARGTNNGCGEIRNSDVPAASDPYANLTAQIPNPACPNGYPQLPDKKKDPPLPPENQFAGIVSWSGVVPVCGDMELTGPLYVSTSGPAVLVIENGRLDTNGYTLRSMSGSELTIVFTGDAGYQHHPIGGGVLDFKAPTSGVWKGVALYQDPRLTSGVDISEAGNSPTWNITGAVYLPKAHVTFSGAVNKSSNGESCFVMVVESIRINGTGSILAHGECEAARVALPTSQVPSRGKLVS